MKFIVILFLIGIVGSLGSALYFIMKDKGGGERAVKALTLRVAFSVALFLLLMAGTYFGHVTQKL